MLQTKQQMTIVLFTQKKILTGRTIMRLFGTDFVGINANKTNSKFEKKAENGGNTQYDGAASVQTETVTFQVVLQGVSDLKD